MLYYHTWKRLRTSCLAELSMTSSFLNAATIQPMNMRMVAFNTQLATAANKTWCQMWLRAHGNFQIKLHTRSDGSQEMSIHCQGLVAHRDSTQAQSAAT